MLQPLPPSESVFPDDAVGLDEHQSLLGLSSLSSDGGTQQAGLCPTQHHALTLYRAKHEHVCCNAGPLGPSSKSATRSKWLAVAMFCLVAALLNADQNLMAPVLSDIAADFGFDARQVPCALQAYCLWCVSSNVCSCSDCAYPGTVELAPRLVVLPAQGREMCT